MREKKRNVQVSDVDVGIFIVLAKFLWAWDVHIAVLVDEPLSYITARLKQLAQGGLISRHQLGPGPACNIITAKGIAELGVSPRSIREPTMYTYEHSLAEADLYTWLCLPRNNTIIRLGDIITERDIDAARERIPVGTKNGRQVTIPADKGIHCPDGYVVIGEKIYALEVERVLKSKTSRTQLEGNIGNLRQRFHGQIWCYEKANVKTALEAQKELYGSELIIVSIDHIRQDISEYMTAMPEEISKKTGRTRRDLIGDIREAIPLNKLEILRNSKQINLEV